MSQDEPGGQDEALRTAAVQVLEAAPHGDAALAAALEGLRGALRGEPPAVEGDRPVLDPFQDYLTELKYAKGEPPRAKTLERMALELQHQLDQDRSIHDRKPGEPDRNVTITDLRAMVIATLLEELAARLSPGAAFGPGTNGEALAGVAMALSRELLRQTSLYAQ